MRHKWVIASAPPVADEYPEMMATAVWECACGAHRERWRSGWFTYVQRGKRLALAPPCERPEAT